MLSLVELFFNGIAGATPTVFLQDRLVHVFKPLWASIDRVVSEKKVLGGRLMSQVAQVKAVAVDSLLNRFGKDLEAAILFGSWARGEPSELSDLDFFVIVRGLPKETVRRRYMVYEALTPLMRKFKRQVSVIEADTEEIGKHITPLLIDIAHDGIILYDRDGRVEGFLKRVRDAVKKAGLTRYRTSDGRYGWKPAQDLKPGEVFIVKLED